jgi:hypothetical protein
MTYLSWHIGILERDRHLCLLDQNDLWRHRDSQYIVWLSTMPAQDVHCHAIQQLPPYPPIAVISPQVVSTYPSFQFLNWMQDFLRMLCDLDESVETA